LLGAIAKYGERKHYKLTAIQPNYVHKDGMIRSFEPDINDLNWFKHEVGMAMASTSILAGKHCKTSYCPARGSCQTFLAWAQENCKLAWYPGEVNGMTDEQLSEALEQAEILSGYQDALRGEAMRRILHQNKAINGYKLVKARQNRTFADDTARNEVFEHLKEIGIKDHDLFEHTPIGPAGVEKLVKRVFKHQGRGAWVKGMEYVCPSSALQPQNQSLTLAKAIDGRKEYKKGSEFDVIMPRTLATDATDVKGIQHGISQ
jgi:hypothetical protein